jgi:mannose-1-phosphate guanylyltransferase
VSIDGRPLIDYWLELLAAAAIRDILVNTHYLAEQVTSHLRRNAYSRFITIAHEDSLLGTAGTLLHNSRFFGGGPAMLVHADNLSLFDMSSFVSAYEQRPSGVEITMMTFASPSPASCGIVELDATGVVWRFHEKVPNPPGNLANGAVYIVSPAVIGYLERLGKQVIDFSTEVIPAYLGRINTFHNSVYHRDIGTPESLETARSEFPEVRRRFLASSRSAGEA